MRLTIEDHRLTIDDWLTGTSRHVVKQSSTTTITTTTIA